MKGKRKLGDDAPHLAQQSWYGWVTNTLTAISKQNLQILALLQQEERQIVATQQTMTDLQNAITNNNTVVGSAVTLIQGIAKQLADAVASSDDAAVENLVAQLNTDAHALAAAVAANTPAAPAPAPSA